MKIYTKTGDKGTTGLYGAERVGKDSLRVTAYGTVDEANASLGLARSLSEDAELDETLAGLQNALFDLGADLATPLDSGYRQKIAPMDEADVARLEALIDRYTEGLEPLKAFILPAGLPAAAALQMARAVTRRAEREVIRLSREEEVNPQAQIYLNRLSDLLFTLARAVNAKEGGTEVKWHVKGRKSAP
jgi:cob(I)alamin adenosyltransferase